MTRSADVDDEFERFVLDFTPTLLRGAYFLVGDRSLAEDAVQSTMLRTSRHWRRARAAPQAYSRQVWSTFAERTGGDKRAARSRFGRLMRRLVTTVGRSQIRSTNGRRSITR